MAKVFAFLRAINVGGHVVKMTELKAVFEGMGLESVETFIASGNVIFETRSRNLTTLTRRIENALGARLGYEVATFLRTLDDLRRIVAYQPFSPKAVAEAHGLYVGLLSESPSQAARAAVGLLKSDVDDVHTKGSELYWICSVGQNGTKIPNGAFEKTLKVQTTFRNIRTLERLIAKYRTD